MVWWQLLVCVCIASGHITYLFEAKTRGTKPASISPLPSLKFSPNFFSLNLKIMFEVNVYYLALLEKSKNFTYFQNYWFDFHLLCGKMITYLEVTSIRVLYISNLFPLCHILIRLFKFLVQNNNWYPTALICKWNICRVSSEYKNRIYFRACISPCTRFIIAAACSGTNSTSLLLICVPYWLIKESYFDL